LKKGHRRSRGKGSKDGIPTKENSKVGFVTVERNSVWTGKAQTEEGGRPRERIDMAKKEQIAGRQVRDQENQGGFFIAMALMEWGAI